MRKHDMGFTVLQLAFSSADGVRLGVGLPRGGERTGVRYDLFNDSFALHRRVCAESGVLAPNSIYILVQTLLFHMLIFPGLRTRYAFHPAQTDWRNCLSFFLILERTRIRRAWAR
jgi:hypothetical protein